MLLERSSVPKMLCGWLLWCCSMALPVVAVADGLRTRMAQPSDTVAAASPLHEFDLRNRRMSMSPFPVEIKMMRRALRIRSGHDQLLPIYTSAGTLYMAVRITKGINWLNGLPRGKYFINNQPITIN